MKTIEKENKIVVYTIPAFGHVNAMLGLIERLVKDGYKVRVYSTLKFKGYIDDTGAEFKEYNITDDSIDLNMGSHLWEFQKLILQFTYNNLDKLLEECKDYKANLIIHDSAANWGLRIGELLNIKSISLCSFIAINKMFSKSYFEYAKRFSIKILKDIKAIPKILEYKIKLKTKYGFRNMGVLSTCLSHENFNIITYDKKMQAGADEFGDEYFFAGPLGILRNYSGDKPEIKGHNNIYVSMGTISNASVIRDEIIRTVEDNPNRNIQYTFYISDNNEIFKDIHNNYIKSSKYYNQKYMLEKCSKFITGSGINSVSEAIQYKKPMLLYPQQGEQDITCSMAVKLGVGIKYNKRLDLRSQLLMLDNINMNNIKNELKIDELMDKIKEYMVTGDTQ